MAEATFIKTAFFATPPEAVWAFLTSREKLGQWFHPAANDLAENQPYELIGSDKQAICWGKVIEFEPPTRLVYTFTVKPMQGVMTTVHWDLVAVAGGTKLTLRHEGLDSTDASTMGLIQALDAGWDEHIGKLRRTLKA